MTTRHLDTRAIPIVDAHQHFRAAGDGMHGDAFMPDASPVSAAPSAERRMLAEESR